MPNIAKIYYLSKRITPIDVKENSGNNLTNYQVMIRLTSSWDGWSLVASDGSDIYFTDSSGNPLYFWIEKFDYANKNAIIWVKIPSIPANSTIRIYLRFGVLPNPYSSYRDGSNTFLFFDDFLGTQLDTTKWTNNGETVSLSNGIATISSSQTDARLVSVATFNDGILEAKIKQISNTDWGLIVRAVSSLTGQLYLFRASGYDGANTVTFWKYSNGWVKLSSQSYTLPDWTADFHILSFIFSGSNLLGKIDYGTPTSTVTDTSYASCSVGFRVVGGTSINVDWIRVRNYVSPEPSITINPSVVLKDIEML